MDHASARLFSPTHCLPWLLLMALLIALLPVNARAGDGAGARQGVHAGPGEIVLLRNVAARPAVRAPLSPGMALIVNPSPRSQLDRALGLDGAELSDADIASLNATPSSAQARSGNTVTRVVQTALIGDTSGNARSATPVSGNGMSNVISAPMGAVGNATRGIGDQVTGALSQLPLPGMTGGNGH